MAKYMFVKHATNIFQVWNVIPCKIVCNKIEIDHIPNEVRGLKRLEIILISKRILFKKIAATQNFFFEN